MTKGFRQLEKDIESFKRKVSRKMARSAERNLERRVMPSMKRKIIENDAVASTELFRSFKTTTVPMGGNDFAVHLTNYAPHSPYVEFGTGGYHRTNKYTDKMAAPPLSPHLVMEIRAWIIMKPSFVLKGDLNSTAAAIAHAIAFGNPETGRKPGTPAQPFFYNTWFEKEVQFRGSMNGSFKRAVDTHFGVGV